MSILVTYIAKDGCRNVDICRFKLTIADQVAPVAICQNSLIVNLSSQGDSLAATKVYATSIDLGSADACTDVSLAVLRKEDFDAGPILRDLDCDGVSDTLKINGEIAYHNVTCYPSGEVQIPIFGKKCDTVGYERISYNVFDLYVKYCCNDIGGDHAVILRVTDEYGNANTCWSKMNIESKTPPTIICNLAKATCEGKVYEGDNPYLQGACGRYDGVLLEDDFNNKDCGLRTYTRTFYFDLNNSGLYEENEDDICIQQVIVDAPTGLNPASIKWPRHFTGEEYIGGVRLECVKDTCTRWLDPNLIIPMAQEFVCTPDADTGMPCWDKENCSLSGLSLQVDTVFINGERACYKLLKHWTIVDWCLYGGNVNEETERGEDIYEAVVDSCANDCLPICNDVGGNIYFQYVREDLNDNGIIELDEVEANIDGYYSWTQVIKVIDEEAPRLAKERIAIDITEDCTTGFVITKAASDDGCAANLNWFVEIEGVENSIRQVKGLEVSIDYNDLNLAAGQYIVKYEVEDGCGNETSSHDTLVVSDGKAPTPLCLTTLSTVLGTDGIVTIWTTDFDKGSIDNCTNQEDLILSFSETEIIKSITVSCVNGGGDMELANGISVTEDLQLWVWDEAGLKDFCSIELTVTDVDNNCTDIDSAGFTGISGRIRTEGKETIQFAKVTLENLSNKERTSMTTNRTGRYVFNDLTLGEDFKVNIERDDLPSNGVSVLDLIFIQRHILGSKSLTSAYEVLAADVNRSETISSADLVELQSVILGSSPTFKTNTSWRFVDIQQEITQPMSPWPFVEALDFLPLTGITYNADFMGIKIGDVTGDAIPNDGKRLKNKPTSVLDLVIGKRELESGERTIITLKTSFEEIVGLQYNLSMPGMRVVNVQGALADVGTLDYHLHEDGSISMLWYQEKASHIESALISIEVEAYRTVDVLASLELNAKKTSSLIYNGKEKAAELRSNVMIGEVLPQVFALYQNEPNPWNQETSIGFDLPKGGQVTMKVYDVTGRVVIEHKGNYKAGHNEIVLNRADISQAGVLYYKLESGEYVAERSMIIVE